MKNKTLSNTKYTMRLEVLRDAKKIFAVVCFFVLFTLIFGYFMYHILAYYNSCEIYNIINYSMYPTINANRDINDKSIVDHHIKAKIGDIIMFNILIDMTPTNVTKRLIATEGDKITVVKEITDESIEYYLQRIPKGHTVPYKMVEDYVADKSAIKRTYEKFSLLYQNPDIQTEEINGQIYIVIPDNYIFFLGDNRASSYDCSNIGPCHINGYRGRTTYLIKEGKNINIIQVLYALGLLAPNI